MKPYTILQAVIYGQVITALPTRSHSLTTLPGAFIVVPTLTDSSDSPFPDASNLYDSSSAGSILDTPRHSNSGSSPDPDVLEGGNDGATDSPSWGPNRGSRSSLSSATSTRPVMAPTEFPDSRAGSSLPDTSPSSTLPSDYPLSQAFNSSSTSLPGSSPTGVPNSIMSDPLESNSTAPLGSNLGSSSSKSISSYSKTTDEEASRSLHDLRRTSSKVLAWMRRTKEATAKTLSQLDKWTNKLESALNRAAPVPGVGPQRASGYGPGYIQTDSSAGQTGNQLASLGQLQQFLQFFGQVLGLGAHSTPEAGKDMAKTEPPTSPQPQPEPQPKMP